MLCPFCIELKDPRESIWNKKREDLPLNRILYENEYWLVIPPLGSFIVGGLLILSKEHFQSCSVCTVEMLDALDCLISEVNQTLHQQYNKNVIFFEHGPSSCGTKGACCVDHAHLNIFPIDFDIYRQLPDFHESILIKQSRDILKLQGREYIWLFDSRLNVAYPVEGVPSQYIRSLITQNCGFPERWNWQDYLGLEEIKQTMKDLQKYWGKFYHDL